MNWWRSLTWPRRAALAASGVLALVLVLMALALAPLISLIALATVCASVVAAQFVRAAARRGR